MTTTKIRQELLKKIDHLCDQQLNQVLQFVNQVNQEDNSQSIPSETGTYEKFLQSGLIGCVEIEENLSITYKQVLAEGWENKYVSP
jgi:protein-arginine kinase activator protein McsA